MLYWPHVQYKLVQAWTILVRNIERITSTKYQHLVAKVVAMGEFQYWLTLMQKITPKKLRYDKNIMLA